MNNIGINLKKLLLKEQLSENELARRIGVPQQIINRIVSGVNQNPKLSTITPISTYFQVPLQELIASDDILKENKIVMPFQKVPYINFSTLEKSGINKAISLATNYITIDLDTDKSYFATSMYDDSMEPKFSQKTILIFEKDRDTINGDFCLLKEHDNKYIFRQIIINSLQKKFIKCMNPNYKEYNVMPLPINIYILATLLESRTNFSIP